MSAWIVIAPFANRRTRDWPSGNFRELAIRCVEELSVIAEFVGSSGQREPIDRIMGDLPPDRYINRSGQMTWDETARLIQASHCVVSNNSGIGHLAADLGAPVVSIFAASHSPYLWMPRGPNVSVIVRQMECSPCNLDTDTISACKFDLACLKKIPVSVVFEEVRNKVLHESEKKRG